ncbi:unnamed protein product [Tetraodon nigroviridis]|uniref:(spotted green pufferfish) hypothetical protein n=1 Tax=Tetraodon nigroviridis TaxID=99883 RepID=Q4T3L3_TETNG|nr:unnamed protein product [Tetraodon nigroviridis]
MEQQLEPAGGSTAPPVLEGVPHLPAASTAQDQH